MQKTKSVQLWIRQHTGTILWVAVGMLLFFIAYWPTFVWLNQRVWAADSFYSHAYLIPLVSGVLIWMRRKELAECDVSSSWIGLALIGVALLVHILSILAFVSFMSGFSILLLVVGICLYLFGIPITLKIWFPLVYLVFMFPMPSATLSAVSVPMKLFATKMGATILDLMGIAVVQSGYKLQFTNAMLVVGNPCSGLRSLIALFALGTLFAYLLKASPVRKIILICLSVIFALISNILRVTLLGLITEFYGSEYATGLAHDLSGILVFFVALLLFYGAARALEQDS